MPGAAGYMMMAGHFSRNLVSSGDLNRPRESRGSQTSGVLLVLFVHAKRIKPFPLRESSEVLQTSNQRTAAAASRHFSGGFAANSAAIGGDIRGFSTKIRKNPRKKVP